MRFAFAVFLSLVMPLLQAGSVTSPTCDLPIKFDEGLIWVEVNVPQSAKPLNFLLDTGASVSVINLSTARRLGLKLGPSVRVKGVRATVTGNWPVNLSATAHQFQLPVEYLALDLTKLSGACRCAVDGLIGADFFCDRIVQIDYAEQKLRLLNAKPIVPEAQTARLEARRCGLRVQLSVNRGKRQWVRLDTGCAAALQWVTTDVPSEQCTSKAAVGLSEISIPQILTSIQIGDRRVDGTPTGLHSKAIFAGESGLLGNGLLAQFGVITIDTKSGCLILGRLACE